MILCSPDQCTGCAACVNSCKWNAIRMVEDGEGFLAPVIDAEVCTQCGVCREVCPILTDFPLPHAASPRLLAAWSLDGAIRCESSSGGLFSVLAEHVLGCAGVVFGAAFDDSLKLQHEEVKEPAALFKLRGSKYLQSDIGDAYIRVKGFLESGSHAMFVGTPCQVAGLYGFLGKDHANLVTCDLVCHGVPSQRFFDDYLEYLRNNGFTRFDEISFRDKRNWGYATVLTDRSSKDWELKATGLHDYYLRAYSMNLVLRRSCYSCKFARLPRTGDITLADFWGIGKEVPFHHDTRQGVSLVLVNSSRGEEILKSCERRLFVEERQLSEAMKMNDQLYKPAAFPAGRDTFLTDMKGLSIKEIYGKYRLKKRVPLKERLRKGVYHAVGPNGIAYLKKWLKGRSSHEGEI